MRHNSNLIQFIKFVHCVRGEGCIENVSEIGLDGFQRSAPCHAIGLNNSNDYSRPPEVDADWLFYLSFVVADRFRSAWRRGCSEDGERENNRGF